MSRGTYGVRRVHEEDALPSIVFYQIAVDGRTDCGREGTEMAKSARSTGCCALGSFSPAARRSSQANVSGNSCVTTPSDRMVARVAALIGGHAVAATSRLRR